jgi:Zn-dependent protease
MLQIFFSSPAAFLVLASALVISITIHEFAHAWFADRLGDPTPRSQGRVTLNPLAHLDPIGTIMILLVGFGWGKPVMFDPYNLKNVRQDVLLIALAGPVSNIILAFLFTLLLPILPFSPLVWQVVITINLALAAFNLLPIHPLDGGKIMSGLLPPRTAVEFDNIMNRYGLLILLAMLFFPIGNQRPVDLLVRPVMNGLGLTINWLASLIQGLFF